jgi:hypothetical protein
MENKHDTIISDLWDGIVYAFYPVGHACGSQVYEAFVLLHQNEFNA